MKTKNKLQATGNRQQATGNRQQARRARLRLAGCALVLTLFTLGCPNSSPPADNGSNGSGNGGGNGGTPTPAQFSVTGAAGTVTNSAPRATITLSWTNPSDAGLTVALSTSPTASTTVNPAIDSASGATNNITVSGLAAETEYTLTVSATNSGGTTDSTATVTSPELPVVLWGAGGEDGTQDGDFGFAVCQTQLTAGASATSGIERGLYAAGYRIGRFLGSTPDYHWTAIDPNPGIDTDPDALGDVASRNIISTINGTTFTSTFTATPAAFTMSQIAVVWSKTSNTDVATVIGEATSADSLWFFSTPAGAYDSGASCTGATVNIFGIGGNAGTLPEHSAAASPSIVGASYQCNESIAAVLCIAR